MYAHFDVQAVHAVGKCRPTLAYFDVHKTAQQTVQARNDQSYPGRVHKACMTNCRYLYWRPSSVVTTATAGNCRQVATGNENNMWQPVQTCRQRQNFKLISVKGERQIAVDTFHEFPAELVGLYVRVLDYSWMDNRHSFNWALVTDWLVGDVNETSG